jgi:hypothetical protein
MTMKTLLSALVALSFVAGAAAPAAASEAFSIKTLDQDRRGGHSYGGSALEQLDQDRRGGHSYGGSALEQLDQEGRGGHNG